MCIEKLQQIVTEDKYSRHNIRTVLLADIKKSNQPSILRIIERAERLINTYISKEYYLSKMVRMNVLKQKNIHNIIMEILLIILPLKQAQPIQSVASKLATHLDYKDIFDGIKTASELLAVVCETNLFDIIAANSSESGSLMVKSNYSLNESTLQHLANMKYLPPMTCTPEELTSNYSSGYITKSESVILGKENHHDKYQNLEALDIASKVELSLDTRMLAYEEISKKPLDTPEKAANHRRLVNSSKVVAKELLDLGNKFYFTWKFDKRGRMYSQGYHINIQSTSYKKSLINLATKHLITGV